MLEKSSQLFFITFSFCTEFMYDVITFDLKSNKTQLQRAVTLLNLLNKLRGKLWTV